MPGYRLAVDDEAQVLVLASVSPVKVGCWFEERVASFRGGLRRRSLLELLDDWYEASCFRVKVRPLRQKSCMPKREKGRKEREREREKKGERVE
jgi:hypothetical protein